MLGAFNTTMSINKKKVFASFGWLFDRQAQHLDVGSLLFVKNYTTSVAPWLKCRGPQLRTPGIDCSSSKLQETQNFCSLHCLQSHEIFRVVWRGPCFCVQSSGRTAKLIVRPDAGRCVQNLCRSTKRLTTTKLERRNSHQMQSSGLSSTVVPNRSPVWNGSQGWD